mgnify:CR=1 FL=1
MSVSAKISTLYFERFQDWQTDFNFSNARQAIFAFKGDVYTGLDAYTIPTDKFPILEDKLRILSGLYGVLKPLDLMQPYRLEMGTSLPIGTKKNLYEFWKKKVTASLNNELQEKQKEYIKQKKEEYKLLKKEEQDKNRNQIMMKKNEFNYNDDIIKDSDKLKHIQER